MVCLFALLATFAPRLMLLILWIFTPLVNRTFDFWLWPLLGLIFLPFTTLMYVLAVGPLGAANVWGWLMVFFGLLIDLRSFADVHANRARLPGGGY
jgi:hypothetical protein